MKLETTRSEKATMKATTSQLTKREPSPQLADFLDLLSRALAEKWIEEESKNSSQNGADNL